MPYPAVPDLVPFQPSVTPNLMADGPYDQALTAIEDYLKSLGEYVDAQFHAIEERFADVEATIDTIEQNHAAVVEALNGVTYDTDHALFAGLTPTGGTVTSPALAEIKSTFDGVSAEIDDMQGQIQEDQASIAELGNELNTVSQWQANASSTVTQTIPVAIDTDTSGVKTQESQVVLFDSTGKFNKDFTQALWNAMAQLYLAAPNDDQTQLLGYLGDNADDDHTADISTLRPKSSAALTAAYEAGGSGGASGLNLREYDTGYNKVMQLYDGDSPVTSLLLMNEAESAMCLFGITQGAVPQDNQAIVVVTVRAEDDTVSSGGVSASTDGTAANTRCGFYGTQAPTPLEMADLKRLSYVNNVVTID